MDERQRLRDLLWLNPTARGTFTLTSGKTSDFYVDGKQTTLDAEGAYLCGRLLFELLRGHPEPIVGVGGMTLGADPLVTAVSLVSYLEKAPIPAFHRPQGARATAPATSSRARATCPRAA